MKIKKENYYDFCLESLTNKALKFMALNNIKYSELEMKSQKWQGRLVETSSIKEILYNKAAENANGKITKPFVILHELGHYFDKELSERKETGVLKEAGLEKTADYFIYSFCKNNLCVFEQFILQTFIENFSKEKVTFTEEEKSLMKDEYKVYFKKNAKRS